MKTAEELNAFREKAEDLNKKLTELSGEELALVYGGLEPLQMNDPGSGLPGFEHPGFEHPGFELPGVESPGVDSPGIDISIPERPSDSEPGRIYFSVSRSGITHE